MDDRRCRYGTLRKHKRSISLTTTTPTTLSASANLWDIIITLYAIFCYHLSLRYTERVGVGGGVIKYVCSVPMGKCLERASPSLLFVQCVVSE